MHIRPFLSKMFYTVILASLQPQQSALVRPTSALPRNSAKYGRIMSGVNFIDKVIPGIAGKLSHWMFRNTHFPWASVDMQLIAFGTASAVFKSGWKSGVKVLRVYKLKIVDVGFYKFQLAEHINPGKVAQIEQHIQRLTRLYQLAKGV